MTVLNDKKEISKIREAGKILKDIFLWLGDYIKDGVSTKEIDLVVEKAIKKSGAIPAFKGYRGYPATICASVNEVVVHGIPSDKIILKNGDIVGIDLGVVKNGYYADAARTYSVSKIDPLYEKLINITKESLEAGIKEAVAGNRLSDISNAIECAIRPSGFKEVRSFVGHGIGRNLHESPEVPNWGERGYGMVLEEGLLLAIEPMVNEGTRDVEILDDGWTAVTKDRKRSAHFENTVMVGKRCSEVLT